MGKHILLGHGGGGRLSRQLIHEEILPRFGKGPLQNLPDAALLPITTESIAFSTDSFVVQPLLFPGGNIGDLAIHGTVNDLAVSGARPRWISLALILEEGLPFATLRTVLDSIVRAADNCAVSIVTGDTKVVHRGQCDGIYINTTGMGEPIPGFSLNSQRISPGDRIVVSGPLGDHGVAVLAAREGFGMENVPLSDSQPIHRLVLALESLGTDIHFMRDPTRGGLASLLNEVVEEQGFGVFIRENDLPFSVNSQALTEILGLDLLHIASEGCLVLFCAASVVQEVLSRWHTFPEGKNAREIGYVSEQAGRVILETAIGGRRVLDTPQGELLPRIC